MQELVTYLHDHNQSYIMMVDPPVSLNDSTSYDNGLNDDVYIKYTNGTVFVAAMWPGASSWVDWLHPNAQDFWTGQVTSFFNADTGVNVDGIWIDMNDVRESSVGTLVWNQGANCKPHSPQTSALTPVQTLMHGLLPTVIRQRHHQSGPPGHLYLAFQQTFSPQIPQQHS